MKQIILFLLLTCSVFPQWEFGFGSGGSDFGYGRTGSLGYALDVDGSTEYLFSTRTDGLSWDGGERLQSLLPIDSSIANIVAYWIFNRSDSALIDRSGNGHDLEASAGFNIKDNLVLTSPNQNDSSLYFNNLNWLNVPIADVAAFNFTTNPITITVWFYSLEETGRGYVFAKHTAANNYYLSIHEDGWINPKATGTGGATTLTVHEKWNNRWHRADFVFIPSTSLSVYIDGRLAQTAASTVSTINDVTETFCIGAVEDNGTDPFYGYIHSVRVVSGALSAQTIENEYYRFNEAGFTDEWTDNGNHSVDSTSTTAAKGTYSGKMISSDVGDTTTNYLAIALPEPLEAGKKYLVEYYVKTTSVEEDSITVNIGDISYKSPKTADFVRQYYHFKATASTGDTIKIYNNKADTCYIDHLRIIRKYDLLVLFWGKTTVSGASQYITTYYSSSLGGGYTFLASTSDRLRLTFLDELGTTNTLSKTSTVYYNGVYNLSAYSIDWTNGGNIYFNNSTPTAYSLATYSGLRLRGLWRVSDLSGSSKWNGQYGELQIIRSDDISELNYTTDELYLRGLKGRKFPASYTNGTVVAWYTWAGDGTTFVYDKSEFGNNLTPTNITIEDRVKR